MPSRSTVLALAEHISGPYGGEVLSGILREVTAAGGRLVVVQTASSGERGSASPTPLAMPMAARTVDAVVAIAPASAAPYVAALRASPVPVVLTSQECPEGIAPSVSPDNRGGVRAGLEHLLRHGHRRIAFAADLDQHDLCARSEAYREAMAEHGLPVVELPLVDTPYGPSDAHGAVTTLLGLPDRPTAVMAATDRGALALVAGLTAAGLRVPEDVAVLGFDDIEDAAYATPSLSSVHVRFDAVGAQAGRLAVAMARGESVRPDAQLAATSVVVPRGSCGCRADLVAEDRSRPHDRASAVPTSRDELGALLHAVLDDRGNGTVTPAVVDLVLEQVDAVIGRPGDVDREEVLGLTRALSRSAPRTDTMHEVVVALTDYLQRLASTGTGAGSPGGTALAAALWQVQAWGAVHLGRQREASVVEAGEGVARLLRSTAAESQELHWLAGTHVRAAVLGLWAGRPGGELRVVGVHDERTATASGDDDGASVAGLPLPLLGAAVAVEDFPPAALVDRARQAEGEVCVVVPVRGPRGDWGLLALLGHLTTRWEREPYQEWAGALCMALESERLAQDVRASRERYAMTAEAANDGFWELDVVTRTAELSRRARELLDLPEGFVLSAETWADRVHPEDRGHVRSTLRALFWHADAPASVELRVRRADGTSRWLLARALGVADEDGIVVRLLGTLTDIDGRKALEAELHQAASFDTITGLPNRRTFHRYLERVVQRCAANPGAEFALVFLDLDGFKLVNDSLGHLSGDELLRVMADRLREGVRALDVAARFGGDELAVLLTHPVPPDLLATVEELQRRVAAPVTLDGHEVTITASIGIVTSAGRYASADDALRDADLAMHHAKEAEPGSVRIFDPAMHVRAAGRLRTRAELRTALAHEQFEVHYQPVVDLGGAPLRHLEALVRWRHPGRGLLSPAQFLPTLEGDTAMILTLGGWMLDEVCRQVATWRSAGFDDVSVALNVAHREFWAPGLAERVADALARHQVPPANLVLEITEGVFMAEPDTARQVMEDLRAQGVRLHIDDFGTGQSSLTALRTFPFDALKIDGSFVRELGVSTQTTELLRVIVDMGRTLDLAVVAEHVEHCAQADHLRLLGCTYAQGWLYSRALPAAQVTPLLGTAVPPQSSALLGVRHPRA
ncbi:EAL domain-containing protein [Actinotalea sp. BY-33]|uniref:EAL domain-containing protein n=1 Tax=Actinotalea soli TaxID=2819234 RepID=A0A939RW54_9CELL|nr:EAL domain-containing protein [Actinotalea soli]MBO1753085.1 EAL domain-containing protein [Actinotalea soli]